MHDEDQRQSCNASLISIMAAVGPQVLDFLPLGSILNGNNSPLLISKSFRDDVYFHLSERIIFDFSQCAHLRKITDEVLIALVRNIIRISRRILRHFDGRILLKAEHLDLSRCRKIRGEAVRHCFLFVRKLQRISLASCSKFDPELAEFNAIYQIEHLRHLDMSGCSKLNTHMLTILLPTLRGENITTLDFSGCSSQINDTVTIFIAHNMPNVEAVNLSGAKKLTVLGFGILTWILRNTLIQLNVNGCSKINFRDMLFCEIWKLSNELRAIRDPQDAKPPNMVDDCNPHIGTPAYLDDLRIATSDATLDPDIHLRLHLSDMVWDTIKEIERDYCPGIPDHGIGLFGKLEELEIDYNKKGMEGLLAIIAWLNGGRLRKLRVTNANVVDSSCHSRESAFEAARIRCKRD